MEKRTKILLIIAAALFLIIIFVINILIKKYEQESLSGRSESKVKEETVPRVEVSTRSPQELDATKKDIEKRLPLKEGPLIN